MSRAIRNILSVGLAVTLLTACSGFGFGKRGFAGFGSEVDVSKIATITAIGYAVISTQPGKTDAQRRLMAIRAARMSAMRDLAEQIHGLKVDGNTTVVDLMVQNDTFRGVVSGIIRGARTVRINPAGDDTYELVLEIDRAMIAGLLSSARQNV